MLKQLKIYLSKMDFKMLKGKNKMVDYTVDGTRLVDDGFWEIVKDLDLVKLKRITKLNVPKDKTHPCYKKLKNMNAEIEIYKDLKPIKEMYLLKQCEEVCIVLIKGTTVCNKISEEFRLLDLYHKDWILKCI